MKKYTIAVLLLVISCLIAYGLSVRNDFLIDDKHTIVSNPLVKNISLQGVFLTPFLKNYYRPLVLLSFALDYRVWGLNPFGYHMTNLFLHCVNGILLFTLFFILFKNYEVSLLSSILFVIHPINSVTVNYISDRGNLLAALWMFCALLAFYYGYVHKRSLVHGVGVIAVVLALLSRENAVLFPLYLSCLFLMSGERGRRREIIDLILLCVFIDIWYFLLRARFLPLSIAGGWEKDCSQSLIQNIGAFFSMAGMYARLLVYPKDIYFFRTIDMSFSPLSCITIITGGIFLGLLLYWGYRYRNVRFGSSWFLIGFLPLYPMMFYRACVGLLMQESWIYFSSGGLFFLMSVLMLRFKRRVHKNCFILPPAPTCVGTDGISLHERKTEKTETAAVLLRAQKGSLRHAQGSENVRLSSVEYPVELHSRTIRPWSFILLVAGVFLFFTSLAIINTSRWKTIERYSRYWLNAVPKNLIASWALAEFYYNKREIEHAVWYYRKAINDCRIETPHKVSWDSQVMGIYNNLGATLLEVGKNDEALNVFNEALTFADSPEKADVYFNMGAIYCLEGRIKEAITCFNNAIKEDVFCLDAYGTLSKLYSKNRDPEMARYSDIMFNYVTAVRRYVAGGKEITIATYLAAEALYKLGHVLIIQDRLADAVKCFETMLRFNVNDNTLACKAHRTLFYLYKKSGNEGRAMRAAERALTINPHCFDGLIKKNP